MGLGRFAERLECSPAVLVVLHVDDLPLLETKQLVELQVGRRPAIPPPEGHDDGVSGARDHLCASVEHLLVANLLEPLLEDRPGLLGSVSARRSPPPKMALGNPAPLKIRREKSDKWLNVAGKRGVESGLYLIRVGHGTSRPTRRYRSGAARSAEAAAAPVAPVEQAVPFATVDRGFG